MLDRCPTQLISSYLDKIIAPMVKTLSSYVKDSQHTLEIFRDFNFLGQNKLIFTKDIIIFYPIVPYPKLLYSILSYFIFFRGHGNESCNLIGSLPGQYFPISAHGPK